MRWNGATNLSRGLQSQTEGDPGAVDTSRNTLPSGRNVYACLLLGLGLSVCMCVREREGSEFISVLVPKQSIPTRISH